MKYSRRQQATVDRLLSEVINAASVSRWMRVTEATLCHNAYAVIIERVRPTQILGVVTTRNGREFEVELSATEEHLALCSCRAANRHPNRVCKHALVLASQIELASAGIYPLAGATIH